MNEPNDTLNVRLREFNFKGVVRYVLIKKKESRPLEKQKKLEKEKKMYQKGPANKLKIYCIIH